MIRRVTKEEEEFIKECIWNWDKAQELWEKKFGRR